ncbi:uncharacterized protein BXZ73DRAFT_42238 [Epithele typhae]|uniref:uncharacterized protein n=1 Tax=Epithele typhae TaxID=378194 RepID=UPI0020088E17|nr:uncharacterized protein BXZ73DRAFT_42238 [Epithele typhae]KAH9941198.1 hypothetical protein BXZ73DRAFT_42238 [Epithele typhae]
MSRLHLSRSAAHPRFCTNIPRAQTLPHDSLSRRLVSSALSQPSTSSNPVPTLDRERLSQLKQPRRGGQDLSQRYRWLERSTRGKEVYGREIRHFQEADAVSQTTQQMDEELVGTSSSQVTRRMFRGLVIPECPKPPADDECCMSGCAVCVYDLYDEARTDYLNAVDKIRASLKDTGIPEDEWPAELRSRSQGGSGVPSAKPNVALSAFEQLELALKAKRENPSHPSTASPTDLARVEG